MDFRHEKKIYEKPYFKLLMIPFITLLAFLAVMTGVQAGEFLYRLDSNIIGNVDTETFRDTIKISLPIIENVYNNGKSSASLTGEIKNLFSRIFDFDFDTPMTILNVQSPLFMSYYNDKYKPMLALDGNTRQQVEQASPDTPGDSDGQENGAGAGSGKGNFTGTGENNNSGIGNGTAGNNNSIIGSNNQGESGNDAAGNSGNAKGGTTGSGSGTGNGGTTGSGNSTGSDGSTGSGNSSGTGKGNGSDTGNVAGGGQAQNGNGSGSKGTVPVGPLNGSPVDLEPVSSITYEAEDEEEQNESNIVEADKLQVRNFTKHKIDIAKLLREPLKLGFSKSGPKVLVYHTHASESYVLKPADLGKKSVPSYSSNPKNTVVRVGEELTRYLKKYGIDTLHNATVHDKNRNAAYGVAIETLQSYKKSYPSIKVFIDVHRDGLDASQPKLREVAKVKGKNAAKVMFVVGTDDMLPHPDWEENLKFVLRVQQKLNEKYPGLAKPVWIVGKRYNQQVSDQAVLIEIGGDGNLLSECLESTKYVAEALNSVMKGK